MIVLYKYSQHRKLARGLRLYRICLTRTTLPSALLVPGGDWLGLSGYPVY